MVFSSPLILLYCLRHQSICLDIFFKTVLYEKQVFEGKVDTGSPAILIISSSALRAIELLRLRNRYFWTKLMSFADRFKGLYNFSQTDVNSFEILLQIRFFSFLKKWNVYGIVGTCNHGLSIAGDKNYCNDTSRILYAAFSSCCNPMLSWPTYLFLMMGFATRARHTTSMPYEPC